MPAGTHTIRHLSGTATYSSPPPYIYTAIPHYPVMDSAELFFYGVIPFSRYLGAQGAMTDYDSPLEGHRFRMENRSKPAQPSPSENMPTMTPVKPPPTSVLRSRYGCKNAGYMAHFCTKEIE